jgi:hypothetical protein
MRNHLQNDQNCTHLNGITTNAGEDPIDIVNDIRELKNARGISVINITIKALIFSQLFEVPLKRGVPFIYTLAELTTFLKNRTHSFVCFKDEGKTTKSNHLHLIYTVFTLILHRIYTDFTLILH